MAAIDEKVKQIIVEQLQVDEAEVTPGASFQEDLGADSLDVVELVMQFEPALASSAGSAEPCLKSGRACSQARAAWPRSKPSISPATPSASPPRSRTSTHFSSSIKKRPARWVASFTSPSPRQTRP